MKTSPPFATLAVLALAILLPACRGVLPTNRFLQPRSEPGRSNSTADARARFDHGVHAASFASSGLACGDCHQFGVKIDADDEKHARALSAHAQYPGSVACHSCHVDEGTRSVAAPGSCLTCHENLWPLLPANHEVGWQRAHAIEARANPASCDNCHRQNQCVDCHARRDTIETRFHERNYRFFHSVAARANPMQCGSCHRVDYCIQCHQQGESGLDR